MGFVGFCISAFRQLEGEPYKKANKEDIVMK